MINSINIQIRETNTDDFDSIMTVEKQAFGYDKEAQYGTEFSLSDFHFITGNPWEEGSNEVNITFKIRHTPEFIKGRLVRKGNTCHVLSSEKLQGIAPGQFGVIYDEKAEVCVGSGVVI